MDAKPSIEERIGSHYAELSSKLRIAADFVAENPVEIATRSLRSVANSSGVSPATFSRLARVLGFEDYEQMREAGRMAVGQRVVPFSERAHALHADGQQWSAADFLQRQVQNCLMNINYIDQTLSGDGLEAAVDTLFQADKVLLVGSLGSAGIIDYFAYQAQWFIRGWSVAGRAGSPVAAAITHMMPGDAVLVITKTPYAKRSVQALKLAQEAGLKTVLLTDNHSSPAIPFSDHAFIIPTESPNFFSSYAATLVVIETIMSMLVAKVGPKAEERIKITEDRLKRMGENWSELN